MIEVIRMLANVNTGFGFLLILAYFYLLSASRRAERSIRAIVEGEGLFNAAQVVEILRHFKTDKARIEALREFANLEAKKAEAILRKVKGQADLQGFQRLSFEHYRTWAGLIGAVSLGFGLLGLNLPPDAVDSIEPLTVERRLLAPVPTAPADGSTLYDFPREIEFKWKPVEAASRYIVEVQIQDPPTSTWHPHPFGLGRKVVAGTEYAFEFVGSQPGRWRVAANFEDGTLGEFSRWSYFEFKDKETEVRPRRQGAEPPEDQTRAPR